MNNHDNKKFVLPSSNKKRLNKDTEDIKISTTLELNLKSSPESKILNTNQKNIKCGSQDIFHLSKTEEKLHDYVHEPNYNREQEQEKCDKHIMIQEIARMETSIKDKEQTIAELNGEIKAGSNRSIDDILEACNKRTRTVHNQIFTISTEISQLNTQIMDLEMKIKSAGHVVNDEEICSLDLRTNNLHSDREAKLMQMLIDYQKFIRDHEELKKKSEKSIDDKTATLKEHIKEVGEATEKLAHAERNTYSILQNAVMNQRTFSSKLKLDDRARPILERKTECIPMDNFHKKRSIEETNNFGCSELKAVKDSIKCRMTIEGKKAKKK